MNSDQLLIMVLTAILNGSMLAAGMIIGTRLTAKNLRSELEDMILKSETMQALKAFMTDQTLTKKATKFLDEATELVSSPEAKNFFKNIADLIKSLSSNSNQRNSMPPPGD